MKKKKAPVKKGISGWIWGVGILVVVMIGGFALWQQLTPAQASLPMEISVSDAVALRDQGAFVLDVREQAEWDSFHIPGATLIPLGELPNRLNEVPKDQKVVVVCRTGHRSQQGRDILRGAGYTLVTSMVGGVTQWQNQGLAIEP
jgi:rhodanese-related sulfurtransferase